MNHIKSTLSIIIFFSIYTHAQLEFTGYGSVGYRQFLRDPPNEYHQEVYYEAKLQGELDIKKDIEAQIDLRGYSDDNLVVLREVSVKFEYIKRMKIKVGNIRKDFGVEQVISRENYRLINRSFINDELSNMGYAQRAVSIIFYNTFKDDKDEKDFPYSYYVSAGRDNSQKVGINSRFTLHQNNFSYSAGHQFLYRGGDYKINANGFTADIAYETKRFYSNIEGFYVKNLEEILRKAHFNESYKAYAIGAKLITAYKIDVDGKVIKDIEPVFLGGYFVPVIDEPEQHTLQAVIGVNIYFDKNARLRANGNLLYSKNQFTSDYGMSNSNFAIEMQVIF